MPGGGLDGDKGRLYRKHAARVRGALQLAAIPNDIETYPDAGHSFMNDAQGHVFAKLVARPMLAVGYPHESAEDAWGRIFRFFGEYL